MHSLLLASKLATALALIQTVAAIPFSQLSHQEKRTKPLAPKVFMINMFAPEADVWYGIPEFDLLAQNITIPGFSPLFPDAHCTASGEICQMVTGESEINAATSVSALVFSGYFDLTKTYFLIAGIAGVNPEVATLASVTFAKYAVQVALQYEFDAREIPANFTNGYVPLGAFSPDQYPVNIYGTEVFEVNEALRDIAISFAKTAKLNDTATCAAYRALYAPVSAYAAAAAGPSVVACDVATSDVYYSGNLLSQAFENTTKLFTNGSGVYCSTAQEDNASLEALLRATAQNLTDFSRIIVMRTCSDFDRPPPGVSDIDNLFYVNQGGFSPSIKNIYLAGVKVIEGIVGGWEDVFEKGIKATNYVGDIFATLGGTPDFGAPADFITRRDGRMKQERERRVVVPRGLVL
jgi:purine nucleoside permease